MDNAFLPPSFLPFSPSLPSLPLSHPPSFIPSVSPSISLSIFPPLPLHISLHYLSLLPSLPLYLPSSLRISFRLSFLLLPSIPSPYHPHPTNSPTASPTRHLLCTEHHLPIPGHYLSLLPFLPSCYSVHKRRQQQAYLCSKEPTLHHYEHDT